MGSPHGLVATSLSGDAARIALPPTAACAGSPLERDLARCLTYVQTGQIERLFETTAAATQRSYLRLSAAASCEAWLIRWPAGSCAPLHDHGAARGLAVVMQGALREWRIERPVARATNRAWLPGDTFELALGTCHEVYNRQRQTAYSLHVYEPRLEHMTFYHRTQAGELQALRQEDAEGW